MMSSATIQTLSLLQPWASLVVIGAKKIETRSWSTSYRGSLAIHASKRLTRDQKEMCDEWPFYEALAAVGIGSWRDLPTGAIVATCRLTEVLATDRVVAWADHYLRGHEKAFGDYTPGRYAWLLADVVPLPEPIPARGSLGLWAHPVAAVSTRYTCGCSIPNQRPGPPCAICGL